MSSFDDDELEGELELSNFTEHNYSESQTKTVDSSVMMNRPPWAMFFLNPSSATLILCYWTQNWIGFLILSELPNYFTEELGFSLKEAGIASMAPYVAQFISTLFFGFLFQKLSDTFGWSARLVRQCAMHICFFGSSICLVMCGYVSDKQSALLLMILALTFYAACQSGTACNFLEISPNFSAELNTLANLFAALSGVASPLAVAGFTDAYDGISGWRAVFFVTFAQCVMASLMWYLYQTSDAVPAVNTAQ